METVNVYDWDKTIFSKDSTVSFYLYCLRRHPAVLRAAPRTAAMLPAYWSHRCTKTQIKERFYAFLRYVPDVEAEVEAFWDENLPLLHRWYPAQHRADDIVISASPEFLVGGAAKRLGLRLLASRVNPHTGETAGENCHGEEKVVRFREAFPDVQIRNFYSDSLSDTPLARLAEAAFLVDGETLTPWPFDKAGAPQQSASGGASDSA